MLNEQVAVTGGSGHLGTCLIQKLLEQEHRVKALHLSAVPTLEHTNLKWFQGDITNVDTIQNLLRDCKTVIHCAALISIGDQDESEVYRVNIDGTQNVVNACVKDKSIRMIHISSSHAVEERPEDEIFAEERPYKKPDDFPYSWSKSKAEQLVLDVSGNQASGFTKTVPLK